MANRNFLRLLLLAVVALCTVGIVTSRVELPEYTINVAFLASMDDEDYIGAVALKEYVEQALPGRVEVNVFPSGQFCGSERECIEAMQSGILEVHQTTTGGLAALFGPAQVLDLPYAFADDAVAECVMDGPLLRSIGAAILEQDLGLRLMVVGNTGGWRSFGTTRRSVQSTADLRGLRIRTLPSALEQQMVRALGGFPTPLPWSEVYSALGAGLLDGTKNSVQDIVGMKLHEHIKHLAVDRHAYMAAMWWFSEAKWRQLPPDVQAVLAEGFVELAKATRHAALEREAPALEAFVRAGGTITELTREQRVQFRAATAELREWYIQRYGREWLVALEQAVAACDPTDPAPETLLNAHSVR
jgi:TRAP-type transport system periplasmic protein